METTSNILDNRQISWCLWLSGYSVESPRSSITQCSIDDKCGEIKKKNKWNVHIDPKGTFEVRKVAAVFIAIPMVCISSVIRLIWVDTLLLFYLNVTQWYSSCCILVFFFFLLSHACSCRYTEMQTSWRKNMARYQESNDANGFARPLMFECTIYSFPYFTQSSQCTQYTVVECSSSWVCTMHGWWGKYRR